MRRGQALIGFLRPLGSAEVVQQIAAAGVTAFSVELMPRTTRAQSMDALSSMGTICGYKAVLLAADTSLRIFPMMTTAAGTITPARVFVIGAGVAGLQAISTARRLGAVASAYDMRPAAKEQVQSLGGRFVELPIEAQRRAGCARLWHRTGRNFLRPAARVAGARGGRKRRGHHRRGDSRQKVAGADHRRHGEGHGARSVIVDLAAERGGNCELTRVGRNRVAVRCHRSSARINLASSVPYHASQMYARNITTFLLYMVKEGKAAAESAG